MEKMRVLGKYITLVLMILFNASLYSFINVAPDGYFEMMLDTVPLRYGDIVQVQHKESNNILYTPQIAYDHPGTSGQMMVTCGDGSVGSWWVVKGPSDSDFETLKGKLVDSTKAITLQLVNSDIYLHSHSLEVWRHKAPGTDPQLQEVTAFQGRAADDDNWKVIAEGDAGFNKSALFKLMHVSSSRYLTSDSAKVFTSQKAGEVYQIVGATSPASDEQSLWKIYRYARSKELISNFYDGESPENLMKKFGIPSGYSIQNQDIQKGRSIRFGDVIRVTFAGGFLNAFDIRTQQQRDVYCLPVNPARIMMINLIDKNRLSTDDLSALWKVEPSVVMMMGWWRIDTIDKSQRYGDAIISGDRVRLTACSQSFGDSTDKGSLYSEFPESKESPARGGRLVEVFDFSKEGRDENFVFVIKKRNGEGEIKTGDDIEYVHEKSGQKLSSQVGQDHMFAGKDSADKVLQEVFLGDSSEQALWRVEYGVSPLDDKKNELQKFMDDIFIKRESERVQVQEQAEIKSIILPDGFDPLDTVKFKSIAVGSDNGVLTVWAVGAEDSLLYSYQLDGTTGKMVKVIARERAVAGSMMVPAEIKGFTAVSASSLGQVYAVVQGNVFIFKKMNNEWIKIPSPDGVIFEDVKVGGVYKVQLGVSAEVVKDIVWARSTDGQLFQLGSEDVWSARTEKNVALDCAVSIDKIILAVNQQNRLFKYENEKWVDCGIDVLCSKIAAGNKTYVYAITTQGSLVSINLDTKEAKEVLSKDGKSAANLRDLSVNAAGTMVLLDTQGGAYKKGNEGLQFAILYLASQGLVVNADETTKIHEDIITPAQVEKPLGTSGRITPQRKIDNYSRLRTTSNNRLQGAQGERRSPSNRPTASRERSSGTRQPVSRVVAGQESNRRVQPSVARRGSNRQSQPDRTRGQR